MTGERSNPAPQADVRRTALAERMADYLLDHGLTAGSLRPLAEAAGLSDRMLIYYFGTKEAAIEAALASGAERLRIDLEATQLGPPANADQVSRRLTGFILAEERRPVMTLWTEIAARAARGHAPYDRIAPMIAQGFLEWVMPQLDVPEPQRRDEAIRVLAQLDGLALLKGAGIELGAP